VFKIDINSHIDSYKIDMQKIIPIVMFFGLPLILSQIFKGKKAPSSTVAFSLHDGTFYILCIGITILFCKDCFHGQSPGKRALEIQVINLKTKQIATPIRCVIRNLFMILCPIEGIILLFSPTRRLGDYVAGTELAPYNPKLEQEKINYVQITLSFLIAYIFSIVTIAISSKF
jgi:hypothetical protein